MDANTLTNEEIIAKMQSLEKGSAEYERYATALLENNEGAIQTIALQYVSLKGATLEDNLQDLRDIMIRFANIYDASQNAQFITYFMNYAGHYLRRFIQQYNETYNPNVMIYSQIKKLKEQGIDNPTDEQIIEALGEHRTHYYNYLNLNASVNFDDTVKGKNNGRKERTLHEVIRDKTPTAAERWAQKGEYEDLYAAMDFLPEKYIPIIQSYYFGKDSKSNIGISLGVTRERARQIVEAATDWMRFLMSDDGKERIERQQAFKRLYDKYVVKQRINEKTFLSRLPYSVDEILDVLNICYCKYYNCVFDAFKSFEEKQKKDNKEISFVKEHFFYLPKDMYHQIIDVCIYRLSHEELKEKYHLERINIRDLYHALKNVVLSPRVNYIFAERDLRKKQKDGSLDKENLTPQEQLILFYNEGYNADKIKWHLVNLKPSASQIIKNVFELKKTDKEIMNELGFKKVSQLQNHYQKALEYFACESEKTVVHTRRKRRPNLKENKQNDKTYLDEIYLKALLQKEGSEELEQYLSLLSDRQQQVVQYLYKDVKTIEQTAQEIGMNITNIYGCKNKALQKLNNMRSGIVKEYPNSIERTLQQWLIKEENEGYMSEAFSQLTEKEQHVLTLLYKENKSQKQIAEDLGVNKTSVFRSKAHALEILEEIQKNGIESYVNRKLSEDEIYLKELLQKEGSKELEQYLLLLSDRQQQVVQCLYKSGQTLEQTAQELGTSGKNVYNTKNIAIEKLKNMLSGKVDNDLRPVEKRLQQWLKEGKDEENIAATFGILSKMRQDVLTLFYRDDLSLSEIAQTLNTSYAVVGQVKHRALKRLKKMYENGIGQYHEKKEKKEKKRDKVNQDEMMIRELMQKEGSEELEKYLSLLSDRQQQVMQHLYKDGWTIEQISQETGKSIPYVYHCKSKAIQKLKDMKSGKLDEYSNLIERRLQQWLREGKIEGDISESFGQLTEREQCILTLRYKENKSHNQIAHDLSMNYHTILLTKHRALEKLEAILATKKSEQDEMGE